MSIQRCDRHDLHFDTDKHTEGCPRCASAPVGRVIAEGERDQLRAAQAAAVMPLIGPLLDAWDGLPGDVVSNLLDESPSLCGHIEAIQSAMEASPESDAPKRDIPAAEEQTLVQALGDAAMALDKAVDYIEDDVTRGETRSAEIAASRLLTKRQWCGPGRAPKEAIPR